MKVSQHKGRRTLSVQYLRLVLAVRLAVGALLIPFHIILRYLPCLYLI